MPGLRRDYAPCTGTDRRMVRLRFYAGGTVALPPLKNEQEFKEHYPADYICEAVDQTRGWFYSLHAISTLLFDQQCFKNVVCLGLILDGDGQKMSKTRGNVVSPWEVLDKHGADAMRWYLYTRQPRPDRNDASRLIWSTRCCAVLP